MTATIPLVSRRTRPLRLLVVDDEEGMLEVLRETMERLEPGVVVVAERDPRRAADRLGERFDVLVTDLQMRGLDGLGLAQRARREDPTIPILVVTGYRDLPAIARCRAMGAEVIEKPFDPVALLERVRQAVAGRRGA